MREIWRTFFQLQMEVKQKYANNPVTYEGMSSTGGEARLMKVLSLNIGLEKNRLQDAFGDEEEYGACLRVNYYPKCPEPELTLGLSSHSDPGGMTLLLPDHQVAGLQVRKDGKCDTVKRAPHAFIVNIGDQIQVLSNAIYKSVEHRSHNLKSDVPVKPLEEFVNEDSPALYTPITFDEYRLYIRTKGPQGKAQVESLQSPKLAQSVKH
ncbi:hypothetical protein QQ045_025985 [Rhodiola kirilowii]